MTATVAGLNLFKPRILHTAYYVANIEKSMKFYCDVLGMQELQRFDLDANVHEVVLGFPESKGGGVILMWDTKRSAPYQRGDGYSRFVMMVSDLDAAVQHLNSHHAKISKPITDVGSLRYVMVQDPDDYTIEILQLKRSA